VDNSIFIVLTILWIIILSGCSFTTKDIPPDYMLNNSKGIVVLFLTAPGECDSPLFVDKLGMDKKTKSTIGFQDRLEGRGWNRQTGDCSVNHDDFSGRLKVIELSPGEYEMVKLRG
jgi:hypothetical protein